MALELSDGFESGSLAGYTTNGSPTIVSSPVNSGTKALQIDGVSATEYISYAPSPAGPTLSVGRVYFRFNTMPGAATSVTIAVPRTASALNFNMRVTSAGAMQVLITGGATQTIATLVVVINQWYRLDWKADCSSGGGNMLLDCSVNDGATDFPSAQATVAGGATTFTEERVGNNNATTADLYLDDLAIARSGYPIGAIPPAGGSRLLSLMGVGS